MVDSALFCMHPKHFNSFYIEKMSSGDYFCGDDEDESYLKNPDLNWDEKYYNPICRSWYKK